MGEERVEEPGWVCGVSTVQGGGLDGGGSVILYEEESRGWTEKDTGEG